MPNLYQLNYQFRARLLARDAETAREMVTAYSHAYQQIRVQLDDLLARMQAAQANGEDINSSWLFREARLQRLEQQTRAQIDHFSQLADQRITAEQIAAIDDGQHHAEQLVRASLGTPPPGVTLTWARLPTEALQDLIGFTSAGTPLRALLDELGPDASKEVRKALISGLALGQHPRVIAQNIRGALGGNLVRALTISRTEVLRSYRESSRRSYQANSDVVKGWTWQANQSRRTCASCLAMDGTFHTLEETLDSHPNCRCVMVPSTKTWAELGYNVPERARPARQTGAQWFEKQDDATKQHILGSKVAFDAYQNGEVDLKDFVGIKHSAQWGTERYARSMKEIRADAADSAAS